MNTLLRMASSSTMNQASLTEERLDAGVAVVIVVVLLRVLLVTVVFGCCCCCLGMRHESPRDEHEAEEPRASA